MVGLSTDIASGLMLGIGHELMLFAAVGILLIGLDDLMLDAMWLSRCWSTPVPRGGPAGTNRDGARVDAVGTLAVFVPAWHDADVLPQMIARALAQWQGQDFIIYVGCYPNDAATLLAASPGIAHSPRLRLVIADHDGPTTKADNLNSMWHALQSDSEVLGTEYAAVILHDAEDHVHPGELRVYRRYLADHAMVQIPVLPFAHPHSRWVAGHYLDEFAESHGKEMPVRSGLGAALPAAGVGCALAVHALQRLAAIRGGDPFRADSLTEDYEVGLALHALGYASCIVSERDSAGSLIASRGYFPATIVASVTQKARWTTGIALAGWDRLGWGDTRARSESWGQALFGWWMLWRDRRAPVAALVMVAAYAALVIWCIGLAGHALFGWALPEPLWWERLLLSLNAALLGWRLLVRAWFTGRVYGLRQALYAVPRALVANIITMMAARRALVRYATMLRERRVAWDKTAHEFSAAAAPKPVAS